MADALDDLSERALTPAVMLGDSHYGSSDNMALTREQNINLVAPARPPKGAVSGRLTLEDFTLNEEGLVLRCPNNVEPVSASLANRTIKNEAKEKPRIGNIRFYPPATRRQVNILHRTAKTCTSTPSANNFLPPRQDSAIALDNAPRTPNRALNNPHKTTETALNGGFLSALLEWAVLHPGRTMWISLCCKEIMLQLVRTPLFPTYREVRHLLKVWPSRPRKHITGLQATLGKLWGTPQNTVDWTDPDTWIPERLSGNDRHLASAIWAKSDKAVNPRHTYGHWLLSQRYKLIEEGSDGNLSLTERGQDFINHEGGKTEIFLDEQEGLAKLLTLVADNGPTRTGGILEEWIEYLTRHSSFGSPSTFRDTLRRRLNNLLDRGLVNRKGTMYTITDAGLAHLQRFGTEGVLGGGEQQELWTLARKQEASVRKSLRELLLNMDPYAFEHLVKRLLEEMNYQNVEVTAPSDDGGVDVVADIELGITSVREVVQAKRHKRTIQRKDLDALRGSLYRFNAVRGTIIATSRFSKGTEEEAFASGVAPITLIDGDKLIDLLIEHAIGVRKRTLEVLTVEPDAFADLEGGD